jgi:arylsulfatase A-like enzyme
MGNTLCFATEKTEANSPEKPNIVIFFADDAGYADFGFQGSKTFLTPNLDALANSGIIFSNAYVSSAVCSPSRAGLHTGRSPTRMGIEFNLPGDPANGIPSNQRGLPQSEKTLASLLKPAGYRTGFIGKWHLGRRPAFHPLNRGFEEFYGFIGGHSKYDRRADKNLYYNKSRVQPGSVDYITDSFADQAIKFVHAEDKRPFFLQISFNAPHTPMQAKEEDSELFKSVFSSKTRIKNAAMVYRMDHSIGRVIQAIENIGQTENTLFFFTNDNGGAKSNGASNNPLRGAKGTLLDGGIKVPFIMSWKKRLNSKTISDKIVSTLDIVPTVANVSGIVLPLDRQYDGINLLKDMEKEETMHFERTLYWRVNWASAIRHNGHKLIRLPNQELWLFDLRNDPTETNNIYSTSPAIAKDLTLKLTNWESNTPTAAWEANNMWKSRTLQGYHQ